MLTVPSLVVGARWPFENKHQRLGAKQIEMHRSKLLEQGSQ